MTAESAQIASPPLAVLSEHALAEAKLERITSGHINLTWKATTAAGEAFIVQRVNPLFDQAVQHDIAAVTRHLRSVGVASLELLPAADQSPFMLIDGFVWRVLRYVPGECFERIDTEDQAYEAGRILNRFHEGAASYAAPLRHNRANIHNHALHIELLGDAIEAQQDHRHYQDIVRLASNIRSAFEKVGTYDAGRTQLVHGDPKISNIVFTNDQANCLIDLDTLNRIPLLHELGDAMRSWCNAAAEDELESALSLPLLRAAVAGYAADVTTMPQPKDLISATAAIAIELAARFCTDALNESYFGWDQNRFDSASDHNQARAAAQLQLGLNILSRRSELESAIAQT